MRVTSVHSTPKSRERRIQGINGGATPGVLVPAEAGSDHISKGGAYSGGNPTQLSNEAVLIPELRRKLPDQKSKSGSLLQRTEGRFPDRSFEGTVWGGEGSPGEGEVEIRLVSISLARTREFAEFF